MQPKDLATVRVTNILSGLQKAELQHFFERHGLGTIQGISLCPTSAEEDAPLVATVTFETPSTAKKALELNGRVLGSRNVSVERNFMGLTVLATPTDPKLDIIAVHGLNGHAYGTWTCCEDSRANIEPMWLRDFLPNQLPSARILVYGYNSAVMGPNRGVSGVRDFALDLLQRITDNRAEEKDPTRPIIFICHSLGGIVVKQALITAHANPSSYRGMEIATRSILFLATPHAGSRSANIGVLLSKVATLAFQNPSKQLLETLKLDSPILSQVSAEFRAIRSPFTIVNFYERRKIPLLNSLVVDEVSSRLGVEDEVVLPIDATHSRICKFGGPSDALFLPVLAQLKRLSGICTGKEVSLETCQEALGLPASESPQKPQRGHFFVPLSPNPQFYGRIVELTLIDDHLRAQKLQHDCNYPIVAIHGLGGIGKTQLVLKYVYERRNAEPGTSTFWISARSQEDIESGYKAISKSLSLVRDVNGRVRSHTQEPDGGTITAAGLRTSADDVALLKDWLLSPDQRDWLLVLDNFDDFQLDIHTFLPVRAEGNVVITTRDRRVIGPIAVSGFALPAMDLLDAERLFLRIQSSGTETVWNEPTSHPEYHVLVQILQEIQNFPLAIDQAASFIRENSPMSLQEYLDFLTPRSVDREQLLRFKQANPQYPESVMTTWEISLGYLERTQPRASWILQLLGFLDHSNIAEELLTATTKRMDWAFELKFEGRRLPPDLLAKLTYLEDDVGFRLAIGLLTSLSLICRNLDNRTLDVHPLVHEWIRVRLNSTPARQAEFTVAAALMLYQSFPLELVTPLPDDYPAMSTSLIDRIDRVGHHVRSLLVNLQDYHRHAANMPLECFVFCEVYYLAGFPKHSVFTLDISYELSRDLNQSIRAIVKSLPEESVSIASFIRRLILRLREKQLDNSPKIINGITESLKLLSLRRPLESSMSTFFLLLTTAVLDTIELGNEPILTGGRRRQRLEIDPTQSEILRADQDRQRRAAVNLLASLRALFPSTDYVSPLIRFIHFMITIHLLKVLSPEEFAIRTDLDLNQMMSPEFLQNQSFHWKGANLSLLMKLLWEYPRSKYYDGIKKVFTILILECRAELKKERRLLLEQQDSQVMRAWSHSSYVSSSWGRAGEPLEGRKTTTDFFTPLEYTWETLVPIAEAISNPRLQWRTSFDGRCDARPLSLSQRGYARDLFLGMARIHKKIHEMQGVQASAKVAFVDKFNNMDADLGLMRIYLNLEDWTLLRALLLRVLQCDSVIKFCASFETFPWEYDQVLMSSQTPLHGPSSPASPDDNMGRSRYCHPDTEPTVPRMKTQTMLHGYGDHVPTQVHERPSAAELRAVNDSGQALAEFRSRLDRAASQFLSRFSRPAHSQSMPKFMQMGIPSSYFSIIHDEHDDAIAALITLSEKEAILKPVDASHYRSLLSALRQIPKATSRHLGRLELIYKIYQRFPAKPIFDSAQATAIPFTSTDSERTQPQISDDSDGYSSDDTIDDLQVDDQDASSELGWDW